MKPAANTKKNMDILIVDDENDICKLIADILKDEGYTPRYVRGSLEALAELAAKQPSMLLLDIWLEGSPLDGLGILEIVSKKYPNLPVVMISGHGNIDTAVTSIKMGAYDFIEKPFKEERLVLAVQKAIENAQLKEQNQVLQAKLPNQDEFVGKSSAVANLMQVIEKYAATKSRILISGAEGTGKKQLAKLFHNHSEHKDGPYIVFSPAAFAPETLEVEIFGKGIDASQSFSDATPKQGVLERAKNGTLVIDEVTNLPLDIQTKLLKALATNKFKRTGNDKEYNLECRLISTTCKDVAAEIEQGRFKGDLYSRLSVVPVEMPSLKERRDDIPALCNYFITAYSAMTGKPQKKVSDETLSVLQSYEWPGNVTQLRKSLEWLLIMSKNDSDSISLTSLPNDIFSSVPSVPSTSGGTNNIENNVDIMSMPLRDARELFEKQYLLAQVNRFGGNISKTSVFIGMERSALHRKLKSLNVHDIRINRKAGAEDAAEDFADSTEESVA